MGSALESLWELYSDCGLPRAKTLGLASMVLGCLRAIFRPRDRPNQYFVCSGKPLYPQVRRGVRKEGYSWSAYLRLDESLKKGTYNIFSFVDQSGQGLQYLAVNGRFQARTLASGGVKSFTTKFEFLHGRWYHVTVAHAPSSVANLCVNGEFVESMPLGYPKPTRGLVQYTVGGYFGCLAHFHLFDQVLNTAKARVINEAGPNFVPATHRLEQGSVVIFPAVSCIAGLQRNGRVLVRGNPSRVILRYNFGLFPHLYRNHMYVPLGWETLKHPGQKARFANARSPTKGGSDRGVYVTVAPSPHRALTRRGGLYLVLLLASPGGLAACENGQDGQTRHRQFQLKQLQAALSAAATASVSGGGFGEKSTIAGVLSAGSLKLKGSCPSLRLSGGNAGSLFSLLADIITDSTECQVRLFALGMVELRVSLLNYVAPRQRGIELANGLISFIMAVESLDKTPQKIHMVAAVKSLMDISYWFAPGTPHDARSRVLRLFNSLVERYSKAFAIHYGPVRALDSLRLAVPHAFSGQSRSRGISDARSRRSSGTSEGVVLLSVLVFMLGARGVSLRAITALVLSLRLCCNADIQVELLAIFLRMVKQAPRLAHHVLRTDAAIGQSVASRGSRSSARRAARWSGATRAARARSRSPGRRRDAAMAQGGASGGAEGTVSVRMGAYPVFIDLIASPDHRVRALAARVLMFYINYRPKSSSPAAGGPGGGIEGRETTAGGSEGRYPKLRQGKDRTSGIVMQIARRLQQQGAASLSGGVDDVLIQLALGESDWKDKFQPRHESVFVHTNLAEVILDLGSQMPPDEQQHILATVFGCVQANRDNTTGLVTDTFWQRSVAKFLVRSESQSHPAFQFSLHLAHHLLRSCLLWFKGGWVALAEMRWCLMRVVEASAAESKAGKDEANAKPNQATNMPKRTARWAEYTWQQLLYGTMLPLLPVTGTSKGALQLPVEECRPRVIGNLIPTMHMLERTLFPESLSFEKGEYEAFGAVLPADNEGADGEGSVGEAAQTKLAAGQGDAKKRPSLRRRKSMQIHASPSHMQQKLLMILLVGAMEHLPLPKRRQDVLRVLLRYLRYVLPNPGFSQITPHILGYFRQLFKFQLVERENNNVGTLVLALCLVHQAVGKVEARNDPSEKLNIADMKRCVAELYTLWRNSIFVSYPNAKEFIEKRQAASERGASDVDTNLGSPGQNHDEAMAAIEFIAQLQGYQRYIGLCKQHEQWFDKIMRNRTAGESKSITENLTKARNRARNTAAVSIAERLRLLEPVFARVDEDTTRRLRIRTRGLISRPSPPGSAPVELGPVGRGLARVCHQFDTHAARGARRKKRRQRILDGQSLRIACAQARRELQGEGVAPWSLEDKDWETQSKLDHWVISQAEDTDRGHSLVRREPYWVLKPSKPERSDSKSKSGKRVLDSIKFLSKAGVRKRSGSIISPGDGKAGSGGSSKSGAASSSESGKSGAAGGTTDGKVPNDDEDDDEDSEGGSELEVDENEDEKDSDKQEKAPEAESGSVFGRVKLSVEAVLVTPLKKYQGVLHVSSSHLTFIAKRVFEDCSFGTADRLHVPLSIVSGFRQPGDASVAGASPTAAQGTGGETHTGAAAEPPKAHGEPVSIREVAFPLGFIRQALPRTFLHRDTALEVFLKNNTSQFFNCHGDSKDRNELYRLLCTMLGLEFELDPVVRVMQSGYTRQWQRGEISNFDYLMHLNTMAGRSYNDTSQYPVFPWILSDYQSKNLDLSDPKVYRDLSKPMGMTNPDRVEAYEERYDNPLPEVPPFHYGSHYSSPGVVLYYLVRSEPFSTLAMSLQGGRFDLADRLFDSIKTAWELSFSQVSDVKELVPEFFCNPCFLRNLNGVDLGTKQNGQPVGNVQLPPWARGSPERFVAIHRQALESEHVSKNLHLWIDLIFGHSQRGPAAVEAKNLFYYLTYPGEVDIDAIKDPKILEATLSQIANFGQSPLQLFTYPHPRRTTTVHPTKRLLLPHPFPAHYTSTKIFAGVSTKRVSRSGLQMGTVEGMQICERTLCVIHDCSGKRVVRMFDLSGLFSATAEVAGELTNDPQLVQAMRGASRGIGVARKAKIMQKLKR